MIGTPGDAEIAGLARKLGVGGAPAFPPVANGLEPPVSRANCPTHGF